MEGISHEAVGLAGHLRLEKLTVLYDDNRISHRRRHRTRLLRRRAEALRRAMAGRCKRVDGHDPAQLDAALSFAVRSQEADADRLPHHHRLRRPTKAGTAAAHGAPLGRREAAAAKRALGWNDPPFDGAGRPAGALARRRRARRGAAAGLAEAPRPAPDAGGVRARRWPAGCRRPGTRRWPRCSAEIAESRPKLATRAVAASRRWRRWCRRCPSWSAARPT